LPKGDKLEPNLSVSAFEQRCKSLAIRFGAVLEIARGEVAFLHEIRNADAVMNIGGRASEVISRNRGRDHRVVPLCCVSQDIFAWTSYREHWKKNTTEQNFRFIEGGFTLHVGRIGERIKPQILRNEWVGPRGNGFTNNAGHPHWQFDALESLRNTEQFPRARFGEADSPARAQEFGEQPKLNEYEELPTGVTIERMHLASAANWWREPNVTIAHVPETVPEIDLWVLGCAAYMRQEVQRCEIISTTI